MWRDKELWETYKIWEFLNNTQFGKSRRVLYCSVAWLRLRSEWQAALSLSSGGNCLVFHRRAGWRGRKTTSLGVKPFCVGNVQLRMGFASFRHIFASRNLRQGEAWRVIGQLDNIEIKEAHIIILTRCSSYGRAMLRVFGSAIARKNTQVSPFLTQILCKFDCTVFTAFIDTYGTREKCHCKQVSL